MNVVSLVIGMVCYLFRKKTMGGVDNILEGVILFDELHTFWV